VMKKILTFILGMMVVASCDHLPKSSSDKGDFDLAALEEMSFETEKLSYSYEKDKIQVGIDVDYPAEGNPLLVNAVRELISEQLGGTYDDDMEDGQQMVDSYGDKFKKELTKSYEEEVAANDGDEDIVVGYSHVFDIKKSYESDHFITYLVDEEIFLNGAHGTAFCHGVTLRKSDGRRFGTDMMRNRYSEEFYAIIKKGLMEYFSDGSGESVTTDEELKAFILTEDDVNYLPMPRYAPYFSEEGVVFIYQPYEISFYAAGMPTFTVPYEKMDPFLTNTAKQLVEK